MKLAEIAKQKASNYINNLKTVKDFIITKGAFMANMTDDKKHFYVEITIPLTCNLTNVDNKLYFIYQIALHLSSDDDFKNHLKQMLHINNIQLLNYDVIKDSNTVKITTFVKIPLSDVTQILKNRFDNIYDNVKAEILKYAELGYSQQTISLELQMSDLMPLTGQEAQDLRNYIEEVLKQENILSQVYLYPKADCIDIYYTI